MNVEIRIIADARGNISINAPELGLIPLMGILESTKQLIAARQIKNILDQEQETRIVPAPASALKQNLLSGLGH